MTDKPRFELIVNNPEPQKITAEAIEAEYNRLFPDESVFIGGKALLRVVKDGEVLQTPELKQQEFEKKEKIQVDWLARNVEQLLNEKFDIPRYSETTNTQVIEFIDAGMHDYVVITRINPDTQPGASAIHTRVTLHYRDLVSDDDMSWINDTYILRKSAAGIFNVFLTQKQNDDVTIQNASCHPGQVLALLKKIDGLSR